MNDRVSFIPFQFPGRRPASLQKVSTRISMVGAVLLSTVALLAGGASSCNADDGMPLMQKLIAAYQKLNSYQGTTNLDVTEFLNGKTQATQSISTKMIIKRPNKINLVIYSQRKMGTQSVYSDGSTFTVYLAVPNQYSSTPTGPDMDHLTELLAKRAGIVGRLDPLYFFTKNKLPSELTELKTAGTAVVNKRSCLVVTGVVHATENIVDSTKQPRSIRTTTRWTWYIDKDTGLLDKIEGKSDPVNVTVSLPQGYKRVARMVSRTVTLIHTIVTAVPNPSIDDSVFVFKAPKNAIRQKSASEMVHDGK